MSLLFAFPGTSSANSVPLKPMPLPHPQSSAYSVPAPSIPSSHTPANNHMLDYLESQVRGMDMNSPLLVVCNSLCLNHLVGGVGVKKRDLHNIMCFDIAQCCGV